MTYIIPSNVSFVFLKGFSCLVLPQWKKNYIINKVVYIILS